MCHVGYKEAWNISFYSTQKAEMISQLVAIYTTKPTGVRVFLTKLKNSNTTSDSVPKQQLSIFKKKVKICEWCLHCGTLGALWNVQSSPQSRTIFVTSQSFSDLWIFFSKSEKFLTTLKKKKKNERKHKILLQNSPLKMAIQLPGLSETAKKKKKSMIAVYLQATKENQTRVSEKNLQKSLYSSLHKSYSFIKKINQSWRFIK